jgi:hypothetical protein
MVFLARSLGRLAAPIRPSRACGFGFTARRNVLDARQAAFAKYEDISIVWLNFSGFLCHPLAKTR